MKPVMIFGDHHIGEYARVGLADPIAQVDPGGIDHDQQMATLAIERAPEFDCLFVNGLAHRLGDTWHGFRLLNVKEFLPVGHSATILDSIISTTDSGKRQAICSASSMVKAGASAGWKGRTKPAHSRSNP